LGSFLDPSIEDGMLEGPDDEDSMYIGSYSDDLDEGQDDDEADSLPQNKEEPSLEGTGIEHSGGYNQINWQLVPYRPEYQCKWCKAYRTDIASKPQAEKFCNKSCKMKFLRNIEALGEAQSTGADK
jgi:hypothetical protein